MVWQGLVILARAQARINFFGPPTTGFAEVFAAVGVRRLCVLRGATISGIKESRGDEPDPASVMSMGCVFESRVVSRKLMRAFSPLLG